jgi:hypothetical protein
MVRNGTEKVKKKKPLIQINSATLGISKNSSEASPPVKKKKDIKKTLTHAIMNAAYSEEDDHTSRAGGSDIESLCSEEKAHVTRSKQTLNHKCSYDKDVFSDNSNVDISQLSDPKMIQKIIN